ncbi:hypothetical protein BV20DRAFT_371667 [Pilatotrama ljubarskyi]|nr:hypothetical protein BV20DRAFT_371667 [Pilatotrama ljubarskyi]
MGARTARNGVRGRRGIGGTAVQLHSPHETRGYFRALARKPLAGSSIRADALPRVRLGPARARRPSSPLHLRCARPTAPWPAVPSFAAILRDPRSRPSLPAESSTCAQRALSCACRVLKQSRVGEGLGGR